MNRRDEENMERLSRNICERDFKPVRGLYIDLVTMKDLRMGLMLSVATPEDKKYILGGLSKWNHRIQRSYSIAYPDWRFTDDQMFTMYTDQKYANAILNNAPDTLFSNQLPMMLSNIQYQNNKSGYPDRPVIHLNVWPLKLEGLTLAFVKLFQAYINPKMFTLIPFSHPVDEVPAQYYDHTDTFVCDDFALMSREGGTMFPGLYDQKCYLDRMVFSSYQVTDDALRVWKEEGVDIWNEEHIKLKFEMTALILSAFVGFAYCHYPIPIAQ